MRGAEEAPARPIKAPPHSSQKPQNLSRRGSALALPKAPTLPPANPPVRPSSALLSPSEDDQDVGRVGVEVVGGAGVKYAAG